MKSTIDRLFGWTHQVLRRCRDRRQDLLDVQQFIAALDGGFNENRDSWSS